LAELYLILKLCDKASGRERGGNEFGSLLRATSLLRRHAAGVFFRLSGLTRQHDDTVPIVSALRDLLRSSYNLPLL
jgi:hypothetical protein